MSHDGEPAVLSERVQRLECRIVRVVAQRRIELDSAELVALEKLDRLVYIESSWIHRREENRFRVALPEPNQLGVLLVDRSRRSAPAHVCHVHRKDDESSPFRVVTADEAEDLLLRLLMGRLENLAQSGDPSTLPTVEQSHYGNEASPNPADPKQVAQRWPDEPGARPSA